MDGYNSNNVHSFHGKLQTFLVRLGSREVLKPVLCGQILSLLICGTAVTSQFLVEKYNANIPLTQGFCNYFFLALVYGSKYVLKKNDDGEQVFFQTMKTLGWKYFFLSVADVMANFLVVKAYQYTSLTSVQVLDCFVIPVVMILSWFVLKTRYRVVHFIGAGAALFGVVFMIVADVVLDKSQAGPNPLLGDILVLTGASCYGLSNVGMEFFMKGRTAAHTEVLAMYGIFGVFISGILMTSLERSALTAVDWSWASIGFLIGFTICMFILYSCMPLVMRMSSAATVNLSILTADLYALFVGIFLFHYKFSPLYVVSFCVIFTSLLVYNSQPPGSAIATEENRLATSSDEMLLSGGSALPEQQKDPLLTS